MTAKFRAAYARGDDPAVTGAEREAAIVECEHVMQAAALLPSADCAEVSFKREMVALDRRSDLCFSVEALAACRIEVPIS